MKKLIIGLLLLTPHILMAQRLNKGLHLPEVTVYGKRPMKDIGVQKTKMDSVMLKENIALSMADVLTFNSSIFVKSYGRATLSTVAFRGTSPSHTHTIPGNLRMRGGCTSKSNGR